MTELIFFPRECFFDRESSAATFRGTPIPKRLTQLDGFRGDTEFLTR